MWIFCWAFRENKFLILQKANRANFCTKFLIRTTNIEGSNINDGKSHSLACSVFKDCLTPFPSVFSATIFQNCVCEFTISFSLEFTFI